MLYLEPFTVILAATKPGYDTSGCRSDLGSYLCLTRGTPVEDPARGEQRMTRRAVLCIV